MRDNRSVRLKMADFKDFVSFVMFFMKNMDEFLSDLSEFVLTYAGKGISFITV